jgi:2-amino-4-hydroxy-6-hydroxymethyldihydropteridine diphosphokinase
VSAELVAVGLGGNLGTAAELEARLRAAARLIAVDRIDFRLSTFRWTDPFGPVADQPRFLNAACAFRPRPGERPLDLLVSLWRIERALGRARPGRPRFGPRRIDLDILRWGDRTISLPALEIPHPRLAGRQFALEPLGEILDGRLTWAARCARTAAADSGGGGR